MDNTTRIFEEEMKETLTQLFLKYHFSKPKAILLANTYTESTLLGVNSHGINRVPLFLDYIENGSVIVDADATNVAALGTIERWDGNQGPGIVNATKCTTRAIELAKIHGMGLVALRNNNHWMRGGTYAKQAADHGCISILFTNTQPNMPPWGGKYSRTGNNPFVVGIPRKEGHVILDMAISQFAFGKINDYKLQGKKLPMAAGWDENDVLSNDPQKITKIERGLPIGYWKGSALSMILDMLTTLLSAGDSTFRISERKYETSVSQVYICIYPKIFGDEELQAKLLKEIIDYTHNVEPMHPGDRVFYPGERSAETRVRNVKEGMPVNVSVWEKIQYMAQ